MTNAKNLKTTTSLRSRIRRPSKSSCTRNSRGSSVTQSSCQRCSEQKQSSERSARRRKMMPSGRCPWRWSSTISSSMRGTISRMSLRESRGLQFKLLLPEEIWSHISTRQNNRMKIASTRSITLSNSWLMQLWRSKSSNTSTMKCLQVSAPWMQELRNLNPTSTISWVTVNKATREIYPTSLRPKSWIRWSPKRYKTGCSSKTTRQKRIVLKETRNTKKNRPRRTRNENNWNYKKQL